MQTIHSAVAQVLFGIAVWFNTADQDPRPSLYSMKRLFEEFWLHFGPYVASLKNDIRYPGPVYHNMAVTRHTSEVRSMLIASTSQLLVFGRVLHGIRRIRMSAQSVLRLDDRLNMNVNPEAIKIASRASLLCWFHPFCTQITSAQERLFRFDMPFPSRALSPLTTYQHMFGLTDQDFDAFVREDILEVYGAEAFLVRLTRLLKGLREVVRPESGDTSSVLALLENSGRVVVNPAFRQRYVSTGFLRALCDLFESQWVSQLDDTPRWDVQRKILTLVGYVIFSSRRY